LIVNFIPIPEFLSLNFRNDLWQEKILFPSAALSASGFEGMISARKGTPKV